jgi:hypothetical protein
MPLFNIEQRRKNAFAGLWLAQKVSPVMDMQWGAILRHAEKL